MGIIARIKQASGGGAPVQTLTAAATLYVDASTSRALVSGSTNCTAIDSGDDILPGRMLTLTRSGSSIPTFTNTAGTTTAGQMDFGMSGTTFQLTDSVSLVQRSDGSWGRQSSPFN